jgi:hypothetical protein
MPHVCGRPAAYRGCFAVRAEKDGQFPALVAQAQALADTLPKE